MILIIHENRKMMFLFLSPEKIENQFDFISMLATYLNTTPSIRIPDFFTTRDIFEF